MLKFHTPKLVIFCFFHGYLCAQNLAPNPGFESYAICPTMYHGIGEPLECTPWASASIASSDYFNSCCNACSVDVPDNNFGTQNAHSGNGYVGVFTRGYDYREYVMAPLLSPLEAGSTYYVEFYVSPGETYCNTKPIGALFTNGPPVPNGNGPLNYSPQILVNDNYINNYDNWTIIYGCFTADGGENFITIGNFLNDNQSPVDPDCNVSPPNHTTAYYFIDDVLVEESDHGILDLELDGPVTECFTYTIDPGIPDVIYHWEDGSNGTSLTVSESGTYTLTITDGCLIGVDSIEVEILGLTNVDLPDDQVTICAPNSYVIQLDPDAGSYSWSTGESGPTITITESGIFGVEFDDGCSTSVDQVEVIVNHAPDPFTLGEDFVLCPNEEITFSFAPGSEIFQWQDGNDAPTYTIFQGGTYALTISNDCGQVSDEVEVTFLNIPEIELGDPVQFICDGESIYFSLDPEAGTYLWQDGSDEPEFEILEAGNYNVSVINECGIAIDQITVHEQSIPAPDFGVDQVLCEGQSIVLSSTGDSGIFVWQDQSGEQEFLVTEPGTYSLTITNDCGSGSDTVVIGYVPSLGLLELGNDISLCPGESVVLDPGIENANYLWQDFSTADTLLIDVAGLYAVTVSNQCTTYSDTVNVVIQNDPPDLNLVDQVSLCQDSTVIIQSEISGVNYLWSDGSSFSEIVISIPGIYALTVSNVCGIDTDTVLVIDGGPAPEVSLGDDISFCPADSLLLMPVSQSVNDWLWSDGSSSPTLWVLESNVITVEVSNACGTSSDTVIATLFEPTPLFDLGVDTSICPGDTLLLQPDIGGLDLTWSDGTQNNQLQITSEGIFYASLSGICGNTTDTIEISLMPPAPVLDLGGDQSLCPGESITIDPGLINVNYSWHDGSTEATFNTTQPGEIILIVSNSCGHGTDTLTIIESIEEPKVNLGPDILACEGDTITIQAGIDGVDYLWQNGSVNSEIDVTLSGEQILQVSNNCGFDLDTVRVDFSGQVPLPSLGPDTTLCEGDILILTSNVSFGTTIAWQDQSTLPQFVVVGSGLYTLLESNHCGSNIDSIIVSYLPDPVNIDLGSDTLICEGESILLFAPPTTDQIMWQDGSTANTFIANAGNLYTLEISNVCGITRDEILISVDNRIPIADLGDEYYLCPEETVELDVAQAFDATYVWNTGSTQSSIEIIQPGEYIVTIFATCAEVTEAVVVLEDDACEAMLIYIPNVFTPNSDGINDVFEVSLHPKFEVLVLQGTIYDRWGNVLYESTDTNFSWDGKSNKNPMMPGVYIFKVEITYIVNGQEEKEIKAGDVTLIR